MILLLSITIRMAVILMAALLSVHLLHRASAALRHSILSAAVLSGICVPLCITGLPDHPLIIDIPIGGLQREAISTDGLLDAVVTNESVVFNVNATIESNRSELFALSEPIGHGKRMASARIVGLMWLIGVCLCVTVLAIGVLWLIWIETRSQPLASSKWARLAQETEARYGIRRRIRLLETTDPALLVTWRFLRPTLLLPSGAEEWPEQRIRAVLCHEIAHVRRNDWCLQMAAELLRAVFWFNPLCWIICKRLAQESERASDDVAILNSGITNSEYASELLDLARILQDRHPVCAASLSMARPSTLEERFEAILNPEMNRSELTRVMCRAIAVSALAVALPLTAIRLSAQEASQLPGRLRPLEGIAAQGPLLTEPPPLQAEQPEGVAGPARQVSQPVFQGRDGIAEGRGRTATINRVLTGTVTALLWYEGKGIILLDVTSSTGVVETWAVEGPERLARLRDLGWTFELPPGAIAARAYLTSSPSSDPPPLAQGKTVTIVVSRPETAPMFREPLRRTSDAAPRPSREFHLRELAAAGRYLQGVEIVTADGSRIPLRNGA